MLQSLFQFWKQLKAKIKLMVRDIEYNLWRLMEIILILTFGSLILFFLFMVWVLIVKALIIVFGA